MGQIVAVYELLEIFRKTIFLRVKKLYGLVDGVQVHGAFGELLRAPHRAQVIRRCRQWITFGNGRIGIGLFRLGFASTAHKEETGNRQETQQDLH